MKIFVLQLISLSESLWKSEMKDFLNTIDIESPKVLALDFIWVRKKVEPITCVPFLLGFLVFAHNIYIQFKYFNCTN